MGRQVAAVLTGPRAAPTDGVVAMLVDAHAAVSDVVVLMLDDYHEIQDPAIHRRPRGYLERLPLKLRVLIAGRADPPLPLGRLRARGQLVGVRTGGLSFQSVDTGPPMRTAFPTQRALTAVVAWRAR